jgi:hypothetical protein
VHCCHLKQLACEGWERGVLLLLAPGGQQPWGGQVACVAPALVGAALAYMCLPAECCARCFTSMNGAWRGLAPCWPAAAALQCSGARVTVLPSASRATQGAHRVPSVGCPSLGRPYPSAHRGGGYVPPPVSISWHGCWQGW